MSSPFMLAAPVLEGTRKALSPEFDILSREVEDGLVLVMESRASKVYHLAFNFSACQNLRLFVGSTCNQPEEMKCQVDVDAGARENLAHLQIINAEDGWSMKYEVDCSIDGTLATMPKPPPPCSLCKSPITGIVITNGTYKLHQECFDKLPKCAFCKLCIIGEHAVAKGNQGRDGIHLHNQCIPAYKASTRPVCELCKIQINDEKWTIQENKHYCKTCKP